MAVAANSENKYLNDWDVVVIEPKQLQVCEVIQMLNLCDLIGIQT